MWSKVKSILRKIKPRTTEELVSAMGQALGSVTFEDISGWFAHGGFVVNL